MTLAASAPTRTQPIGPHTVPIVILGTDAVLAASPATAVQLAHACLRAGFANVIPASWGDELIAAAVLRRLPKFGNGPAIQCSCPIVAHRLLTVGGDLRPVILALVPPPVAIARYIRVLSQPAQPRLTYVGRCPGAIDDSIDIRMTPEALFAMLAERDILLEEQPDVFESIVPPDRRRFRSQPGGIPSADALWAESGSRALVEIEGEDIVAEVAQHLLTGRNVLIDTAVRLGCVCSGAIDGQVSKNARIAVTSAEPPRATTPVVVEHAPIELDLHVPAASRTPIDVMSVPASTEMQRLATPPRAETPLGHRITPVRPIPAQTETRPNRTSGPTVRPPLGSVGLVQHGNGKTLPRTYVARRRSFPKGVALIPEPVIEPVAAPEPPRAAEHREPEPPIAPAEVPVEPTKAVAAPAIEPVAAPAPSPARPPTPSPARPSGRVSARTPAPAPSARTMSLHHLILILVAVVVVAIGASAVVAAIVARSTGGALAAPAATTTNRN